MVDIGFIPSFSEVDSSVSNFGVFRPLLEVKQPINTQRKLLEIYLQERHIHQLKHGNLESSGLLTHQLREAENNLLSQMFYKTSKERLSNRYTRGNALMARLILTRLQNSLVKYRIISGAIKLPLSTVNSYNEIPPKDKDLVDTFLIRGLLQLTNTTLPKDQRLSKAKVAILGTTILKNLNLIFKDLPAWDEGIGTPIYKINWYIQMALQEVNSKKQRTGLVIQQDNFPTPTPRDVLQERIARKYETDHDLES